MAKVFVGNFSFSVTDDQLREHFSKLGTVISAKVMKEGQGGRSRGFGFVEFANAEDAEKAIREYDGQVWEGRVVKVSEDRSGRRHEGGENQAPGERPQYSGGYSGGNNSGGGSYSGGGGGYSGGRDSGGDYQGGGEDGGSRYQSGPTGYFRAQPLDLGVRRRKKLDPFLEDTTLLLDYKDVKLLMRFMSERGRILPRRMTGLTSHNQRQVTRAIKRAQNVGLLPFSADS